MFFASYSHIFLLQKHQHGSLVLLQGQLHIANNLKPPL